MRIPDTLIANQLRNMSDVLDLLVKDGRLYDHTAINVQNVAKQLRNTAAMMDRLPPWSD